MSKKASPPHQDLTAKILVLAQNLPDLAVLWLYGSRPKGISHQDSDYDFAVAFSSYLTDPLGRRLRPE